MRQPVKILLLSLVVFAIMGAVPATTPAVDLTVAGITEFALPTPADPNTPATHPASLVVGPDGNIWLTDPFAILPPGAEGEPFSGRIAVFDLLTKQYTEYDLPIPEFTGGLPTTPHAITVGPDGNLWFTAFTPPIPGIPFSFAAIGTFDPIERQFLGWFPLTPDSFPHIPVPAPDGSPFVYFTEMGTPFDRDPTKLGQMARINVTTKLVETFPEALPEAARIGNNMHGLNEGPDDNLWVAFRGLDQVARFNIDTLTFDKFVQFSAGSGPNDVRFSPFDNKFYVTLQDSKEIGSFSYTLATDTVGAPSQVPAFTSPAEDVVVGNVVIGPDGHSIWYPGTLEEPLTDENGDGLPDAPPRERIVRRDLTTGTITEFACGLVPTVDPIEVIVGPDDNIWFSETNPGILPPPAINPNPGKLGRLVPAEAEAFGNGTNCVQGSVLWSRVVLKPFGPPENPLVPDVDIFLMNPDGTAQTNLTDFPGDDVWGAWSPDGVKIAWTTNRDGNAEIYAMNADGTNPTRLTDNPAFDFQPAWSPDGTKIAFTSLRDGNAEIYVLEVKYVVDPLTPENGFDPFRAHLDVISTTRLTNNAANDSEPAWSPDGTKLAFTSDRDGNFEIYLMNPDGTGQTNLSHNPAADTEADWSPDGTQIAFGSSRDVGGNGDIYVMDANGGNVQRLTDDPAVDLSPAWSPDATKIVFTALRNGQDEIYVMDADGDNETRLTDFPESDFLPDWQPLSTTPSLPLPASFDLAFVPPAGTPPFVSIANSTAIEEQGVMVFIVTLTDVSQQIPTPSTQTVMVSYLTGDPSPAQAAPLTPATNLADYIPQSGLLIFQPGEVVKQIIVPLVSDGPGEPNEVFAVRLFLPLNAIIPESEANPLGPEFPPVNDGLGIGKITNQTLKGEPAAGEIIEFPLLLTRNPDNPDPFPENPFVNRFGHPGGLVYSPADGAFWGTDQFDARLLRFDPETRTASEFFVDDGLPADAPPGVPRTFPHFIMIADENQNGTTDDDLNLWFTTLDDHVGRVDLSGPVPTIQLFSGITPDTTGPVPGSSPHAIVDGRDGFLYFTLQDEEFFPEPGGQNKSTTGRGRLARISIATKQIEEFPNALPPALRVGNRMHGVGIDAAGNIWVGLEAFDQLARFNKATQTFDTFVDFSEDSGPHDILTGPDGKLYVVLQDANKIGRVDPEKLKVKEFRIPGLSVQDGPSLVFLAVSPDEKSLFFSEFLNDRVGKFDLKNGKVTEFFLGITPGSGPIGIFAGPDDNIWFTEPVLDPTQPGRMARLRETRGPRPPNLTCPGDQTVDRIDEKVCEEKPGRPLFIIQRVCCKKPDGKVSCRHFQPCPRVPKPLLPLFEPEDLGALPGFPESVARGINDAGQIVGKSDFAIFAPVSPRATLWQRDVNHQYVPIDLGTIGGATADAFAINAAGQVVGTSTTVEEVPHAFLWEDVNHNGESDPGEMIDLGTLGGPVSFAFGINSKGQVVGSSINANFVTHAFVWEDLNANRVSDPGEMVDLGALTQPNSDARGINKRGQIIGFEFLEAGEFAQSLLWFKDKISPLNAPPVPSRRAISINKKGEVSGGQSTLDPNTNELITHGFVLRRGDIIDLGTLGGAVSSSTAINDRGEAVGNSERADKDEFGEAIFRGYFWEDRKRNGISDPGEMTDLGTLGGTNSSAFGINNNRRVVGAAQLTGNIAFHAVVWNAGGF